MAETFYPFVENGPDKHKDIPKKTDEKGLEVRYPARIAIYDDVTVAPRVVVIETKGIHDYLEEITLNVVKLSHEQGGTIPFMVIREVVENFIHASFIEPTISILDSGNTLRFSDQGPGIKEKDRALEFGTSSASEEMKRYIRGVGAGLPYAQLYMEEKGGYLEIQDNILGGTVVTISLNHKSVEVEQPSSPQQPYQVAPQPTFVPVYQQPVYQQPVYQQPVYQQPQPFIAAPELNARERDVLIWLSTHESVGPTDLVAGLGSSAATWSRTLTALDQRGLIEKHGQKRFLTQLGTQTLSMINPR